MKPLVVWVLTYASVCYAQWPDGKEILDRVDRNMSAGSRILTSKMVIRGERESRTIESKTWAVGEKKSFTEFMAPAREKGTKMLKLENVLWMYSPSTDRTIQIAGHLLRQSVMGSDLSYDDMMEDPRLTDHYDSEVTDSATVDGTSCWVLQLTARTPDVSYHSRRIWVDKEEYVPRREELYAKSGKLLKRTELSNVVRMQDRWFPTRIVFKDMLKTGNGTEFVIESVAFDVPIPAYIFSKAALKK